VNQENSIKLKLPRAIESDDRFDEIEKLLTKNSRPLWRRGTLAIPHLPFSPALEKALVQAKNIHQVERGLEGIERLLLNEAKGLEATRKKQGAENPNRISRLLILTSDGSERFYRSCESLLIQHADRVLGLRVGASSPVFSKNLFGEDKLSRALLVSDRDSVSQVLVSLAEP
jgi:hypothetical protein